VGRLITDAELLEKRGETDSAIAVLKNAEHFFPENLEVEKLLAASMCSKWTTRSIRPPKRATAQDRRYQEMAAQRLEVR